MHSKSLCTWVGAGQPKEFFFHKLYLSPFTDAQVDDYMRRKFRFRQRARRRAAREIIRRIPDLVARPMLLAHVEDLAPNESIRYSFQVYEEMVKRWIDREPLDDKTKLREFSRSGLPKTSSCSAASGRRNVFPRNNSSP